jgi:hypothetical protein
MLCSITFRSPVGWASQQLLCKCVYAHLEMNVPLIQHFPSLSHVFLVQPIQAICETLVAKII